MATIEVVLRYGPFDGQSKELRIKLDEETERELMGPVEHSNDHFSLAVKSPRFNAQTTVQRRERTLTLRRQVADKIGRHVADALYQEFGVRDELDGYPIEEMTAEERIWYARTGRLPKDGV